MIHQQMSLLVIDNSGGQLEYSTELRKQLKIILDIGHSFFPTRSSHQKMEYWWL